MILSQTPCRISFAGGGSDIEVFYREHPGAVISVTIDKYIYISVNEKFDQRIRVSYSRTEDVETAEEVEHPIVRECLKMTGIGGVEITSVADIPSRGTGLGSSSAFTVGLLNSLYAYQGRRASAEELAQLSCEVEIERCRQPIGKQDQYAAAFGGLKMYRFLADGRVSVAPVVCSEQTAQRFQRNLMMFYTGVTRSAGDILERQGTALRTDNAAVCKMKRMVEHAEEVKRALETDQPDVVGEILHESWTLKRSLAEGISNGPIDSWYRRARAAGAVGGKILGAGGGGFLLLYVPQERQGAVAASLAELRQVPFRFEKEGSKIVFRSEA